MTNLDQADLRLVRALNGKRKENPAAVVNLRIAVHSLVHRSIKSNDKALMLTWLADQLESAAFPTRESSALDLNADSQ